METARPILVWQRIQLANGANQDLIVDLTVQKYMRDHHTPPFCLQDHQALHRSSQLQWLPNRESGRWLIWPVKKATVHHNPLRLPYILRQPVDSYLPWEHVYRLLVYILHHTPDHTTFTEACTDQLQLNIWLLPVVAHRTLLCWKRTREH